MRTIASMLLLVLLGVGLDRGVINKHYPLPSSDFVATGNYHGIEVENHVLPSEYLEKSISEWKVEVSRRFPNALLIVGHGGDVNGVWHMQLQDQDYKLVPVAKIAADARARNPGRVIILICCNPNGHSLHMPGVYHAHESVWFTPDKDINRAPDEERQAHDEERLLVGNIYEFADD